MVEKAEDDIANAVDTFNKEVKAAERREAEIPQYESQVSEVFGKLIPMLESDVVRQVWRGNFDRTLGTAYEGEIRLIGENGTSGVYLSVNRDKFKSPDKKYAPFTNEPAADSRNEFPNRVDIVQLDTYHLTVTDFIKHPEIVSGFLRGAHQTLSYITNELASQNSTRFADIEKMKAISEILKS
ncbi:MAG TPA: hypothetical protein VHE53_02285 [Patescibacteria group bacterium]|nr:hypothetical protein [Patescibacteria group bacterium]